MKSYTVLPYNVNDFSRHFAPFEGLMNSINGNQTLSYDIEKTGEDSYKITLAVPGFVQDDLSVTVHDNVLTIKGVKSNTGNPENQYLHKGIHRANFEKSFQIGDFFLIDQANLADGLLTISMTRRVPEEKKPKTIPIQNVEKPSELLN